MTEKYPEHQKLSAISDKSQAIGEFLDWLSETKGIELATRHRHTDSCCDDDSFIRRCGYSQGELKPELVPLRKLLSEFFEIDDEKIETEKRAMLKDL